MIHGFLELLDQFELNVVGGLVARADFFVHRLEVLAPFLLFDRLLQILDQLLLLCWRQAVLGRHVLHGDMALTWAFCVIQWLLGR